MAIMVGGRRPTRALRQSVPIAVADILGFLRENFPDGYCAPCLAMKLIGDQIQMLASLRQLVHAGALMSRSGPCPSCGRTLEVFTKRHAACPETP
jgi:hypothetical protein